MSGAAFRMVQLREEATRVYRGVRDPAPDVWASVARRVAQEDDRDELLQMLGVAPYKPGRRPEARCYPRRNYPVRTHNASGYKSGCRCDVCREAIREYRREHKPPVRRHGTESAYMNAGCRCEPCRQAAAEARRLRKVAA